MSSGFGARADGIWSWTSHDVTIYPLFNTGSGTHRVATVVELCLCAGLLAALDCDRLRPDCDLIAI